MQLESSARIEWHLIRWGSIERCWDIQDEGDCGLVGRRRGSCPTAVGSIPL